MKKILIIEDNKDNSDLVSYMMTAAGFEVLAAMDGPKGLKLAADKAPDLILLDLMMPDMNGWAVAERLKADPATASIPFIIFTALSDSENKRKAKEIGAAGYVTKPIDDIAAFSKLCQDIVGAG
jgi:CheY-like chemotaxis protein